jgi:hypothetical protein
MKYGEIDRAVRRVGMFCRGGFVLGTEDQLPDAAAIVMIGNAGPDFWRYAEPNMTASGDPLDDWTRRALGPIAETFGARPLFPFDGPPFYPFQQWARRAEPVHPSPVGTLIHPEFGLWHAYRAAFALPKTIELPRRADIASPCDGCPERPCLHTCPVDAFGAASYDVPACVGHIETPEGADCLEIGCRARRACPVGARYLYPPAQSRMHMVSFAAAQRAAPSRP